MSCRGRSLHPLFLMVYGYNRIPIVDWMKKNAQEGLVHAQQAGELVTLLGGHPSLKIGNLLKRKNMTSAISCERAWTTKKTAIDAYYELLELAEKSKSVLLEEYAREMIVEEETHTDELTRC